LKRCRKVGEVKDATIRWPRSPEAPAIATAGSGLDIGAGGKVQKEALGVEEG
jgi:hypothetical protein